jgi:dolichyl-phosphate-mannose-protein mannosyltransferase
LSLAISSSRCERSRLYSPTQEHVAKHFLARAFGLIFVPAVVYLFWFWVHFTVLNRSGTGDEFMSPAFQQTLLDSPLTLNAEGELALSSRDGERRADAFASTEIRYYDTIVLQHRGTKAFLHSHVDRYPLKYDDGRISSAGECSLSLHFRSQVVDYSITSIHRPASHGLHLQRHQ